MFACATARYLTLKSSHCLKAWVICQRLPWYYILWQRWQFHHNFQMQLQNKTPMNHIRENVKKLSHGKIPVTRFVEKVNISSQLAAAATKHYASNTHQCTIIPSSRGSNQEIQKDNLSLGKPPYNKRHSGQKSRFLPLWRNFSSHREPNGISPHLATSSCKGGWRR